jgi:enamine deaminase RidA (YjgF/YER057c/UK114 family)
VIRQRTTSGAPWEERYGYSRAVRVGDLVFVAGTSATGSDGTPVAAGDPHGQTLFILRKIERALHDVGASLADVVRARYFVTDIGDADPVGRAHAELLGGVRPAMTMAEVSGLMMPEHLVEIEVDAVVTAEEDGNE